MKRWERPLLLFSLALNVAFVSVAATRATTRERRAPQLLAPDSPRAAEHLQRWRDRRHRALVHRLDLDPEQARTLDSEFENLRPRLRELRREIVFQRAAYARALAAGDAHVARAAARELSRAQVGVDSLCAEAMLRETSVMRPDQRARYVRWAFRGPPRRRGFGSPHIDEGSPRPH
jgi:Spy/CpxP family protein refolding chaperone